MSAAPACPHCGRINDVHAHTEGRDDVPSGGDLAICWDCHGVAVFVETPLGLAFRVASEEELAAFAEDPAVRRALGALNESYRPADAIALLRGEPAPRPKVADAIDPGVVRDVLASVRSEPLEERLPCGCEMGTVGDAFVMRPCSPDCKYWRYAMAEAERAGKPVGLAYDGGN